MVWGYFSYGANFSQRTKSMWPNIFYIVIINQMEKNQYRSLIQDKYFQATPLVTQIHKMPQDHRVSKH